jgi:hypothetical protein
MLLYHLDFIYKGVLWLMLLIFACGGYAYLINARRPDDDPKKRDFHPAAIFLAPFTWLFFLFAWIVFFVFKTLIYGIFLILFTIALLAFRKPFLLIWLDKTFTRIGDKLLEANTFLIRIVFGDWGRNSQPM